MNNVNMPFNEMAEVATLGALITHKDAINLFMEREIDESMFYKPRSRRIVKAILDVYELHGFVEVQVVVEEITKDKKVATLTGGLDYLMNLVDNASTLSSLDHYLDIIEEKHRLRLLINLSQEIIKESSELETDVSTFLFETEERVMELTRSKGKSSMQSSEEVVKESLEAFHKALDNNGEITGLKTGFQELDFVTNGLQKGDLIIIGSRPSTGKSAFALNLALNTAQLNNDGNSSVAFFSLEMPSTHLMNRLISTTSTVPNHKIRNGKVNQDEYNSIMRGANELQKTNIFVNDESGTSVPDIFKQCRALKQDGGLDFIIIDYLQLLESKGDSHNRQLEVSKMSRQLKKLAREMDVPVIALSQLSRNLEHREDKRPRLSDLRESGSIEQDGIV